jgi:hypothetical protein
MKALIQQIKRFAALSDTFTDLDESKSYRVICRDDEL